MSTDREAGDSPQQQRPHAVTEIVDQVHRTELITIPPTCEGVVHAINRLASHMHPWTPANSLPARRQTLPRIEWDTSASQLVANSFADALSLSVPADLETIYSCSPLAFYLGCRMQIADDTIPVLHDSKAAVLHRFGEERPLDHQIACLLSRCFTLDWAIRERSTTPPSILLQHLDQSLQPLRSAAPDDRFRSYSRIPEQIVDSIRPAWPLTVYLPAEIDAVRVLPYAFERMSTIAPAMCEPLPDAECVDIATDRTFRSECARSHTLCRPRLQDARYHGWYGPNLPIDTFGLPRAVADTSFQCDARNESKPTITVVFNEPDSDPKEDASFFGNRTPEAINRALHVNIDRDTLASILEAEHEYVHFIGHCEGNTMACTDGLLSIQSISQTGIRSFFINGCDSLVIGKALIERGATVGGVTRRPVTEKQAATVGKAFIDYLCAGFNVEQALRFARRQVIMVFDYVVLGDGTFRLPTLAPPQIASVETNGSEQFTVSLIDPELSDFGVDKENPFTNSDSPRMGGHETVCTLSRTEYIDFIRNHHGLIYCDGGVYWPDELLTRYGFNTVGRTLES